MIVDGSGQVNSVSCPLRSRVSLQYLRSALQARQNKRLCIRLLHMADWFVYQRDVYPNDIDPDTLGTMLVPEYDVHGQVVYCDAAAPTMHGVRRVRTRWGINPHLVQYDLVVHAIQGPTVNNGSASTAVSSSSPPQPIVQTVHWWPKKEAFRFFDLSSGFRFENHTQRLCLCVTRDTHGQHHATLHQLGTNGECLAAVGHVVGIRVHELALFAPGSEGWFTRFSTTSNRSSTEGTEWQQGRASIEERIPQPMLV